MQFKDVIGQSAVKRRLIESVKAGRVPHAQLIVGPDGAGKLPLALAYAQYLACTHRTDEDSCGQCPSCMQFARMEHPDLHFVFPIAKDSERGIAVCDDVVRIFREAVRENPYITEREWYAALGVENKQGLIYEKEAGEILRKLGLKAFGAGYKTMIIWLPEKMNIACANSLLKILEEPAPGTLFLLASDHPELLLETIRSRVQTIELAGEDCDPQMAAERQEKDCEMWFEDFVALMRNVWSIGQAPNPQMKYNALKAVREWSLRMADSSIGRERQRAFLQYAQRQIRENFIRNFALPTLNHQTAEEARFSEKFAPFIHSGNTERIMLELDKAEQQIAQNGNAKIILFDMCLQLIVLIKR